MNKKACKRCLQACLRLAGVLGFEDFGTFFPSCFLIATLFFACEGQEGILAVWRFFSAKCYDQKKIQPPSQSEALASSLFTEERKNERIGDKARNILFKSS